MESILSEGRAAALQTAQAASAQKAALEATIAQMQKQLEEQQKQAERLGKALLTQVAALLLAQEKNLLNKLIQISGGACPEMATRRSVQTDRTNTAITCPASSTRDLISYKQLLQAYFQARYLRPATQRSYHSVLSAFNHAVPGHFPDTLTTEQLLAWRKSSLAKGLRAASWNCYMRHLGAVFRFGLKNGLLMRTDNPFFELFLADEKRKKKVLHADNITIIVEAFSRLHHMELTGGLSREQAGRISPLWFWRTVFETLYQTGIRRNQLVHLRWMDVDLQENRLHIRVEGSKTHREYDVPINNALRPWLELLLNKAEKAGIQANEQLFNITRFKTGFRKHTQMNGEHLSKAFTELSRRLGFPVSPHRLRHTLGSSLMRNPNADLHLVKALMGHTSIKTTLEYIEPDMEQMRALLNLR